MTQYDSGYSRRSEWHLSMAQAYRSDADLMLERNSLYSAGALLYESAKQCVNALANQQGQNPGYTRAKTQYIRNIAGLYSHARLENGWQSASRLHIHADRGNLDEEDFHQDRLVTQAFITDMLTIFAMNASAAPEVAPDSGPRESET